MALPEIGDVIDSHARRETARYKRDLTLAHFHAKDIGQYVALVLNGSDKVEILELWDCFPELFGEEETSVEKERSERQLAVYKAQMIDYTHRHNKGGGK